MQDIVCPSGLRGTIRGLKVKEKGFLTDAKLLRSEMLIQRILESCWVKTDAVGPAYSFGTEVPVPLPWDEMLQGDRLCAFNAIRVATWGREFEMEVSCNVEMCKHRFVWVVDLEKIPVKRLTEADAAKIRSGAFFETDAAGKKVTFRPLVGRDTQLVASLNTRGFSLLAAGMAARIVRVDGIEEGDPQEIASWIDGLEAAEGDALQAKLDAVDCGLDTSLEIECPKCGGTQASFLPLVLSFFVTGRTKTLPRIVAPGSRASSTPSGKPAGAGPAGLPGTT